VTASQNLGSELGEQDIEKGTRRVGFTAIDFGRLKDQLSTYVKNEPPACECVAVLELRGHSRGPQQGIQIGGPAGRGEEITVPNLTLNYMKYDRKTRFENVTYVGRELKATGLFCKECLIILNPALFTVLCEPSASVVRKTLQEPGFVRQQGRRKGDTSWVKAKSRCSSPRSIAP
jgi:hypothetical protein